MDPSDQIYVWGSDTWGQLGLGSQQSRFYSLPQVCSYSVRVLQVACGEEHALLLTPEGVLYAFGSNADGRLGIGDRSISLRSMPTLVPDLASCPVVGISCGAGHSAAVSASGDLYTWGQGRHGALGTGGSLNHWAPQQVSFPSGYTVKAVFCGGRHTSALVNDPASAHSTVYICGAGEAGQLGLGRKDSQLVLKRVHLEAEVTAVAPGYAHTLFLTSSGSVYSTGSNASGQLGTGNRKSVKRPVLIAGLSEVAHIAAGTQSAAITRDSKLYLWGSGVFGEYLTPQRVKSAVEAQRVSLGSGFGAVVDSQGHIWTWGSNAGGELGHGDTDVRLTPFPVMALKDRFVRLVACGSGFTVAVGAPSVRQSRSLSGDFQKEREGRARSSLPGNLSNPQRVPPSRLHRDLEDWKLQASEAQSALAREERDFAWRSQSTGTQLELMAERAKRTDYLEERLRGLENALQATQLQLQSTASAALLRVEETNRRRERVESDLKTAKSDINRLEAELMAALRAKADTEKQLERTTFSTEAALQDLSRRQSDLESSCLLQSHSSSSQLESLRAEKTHLSTSLQRSTEAREVAEAETEQLQAQVQGLESAVQAREEELGRLRSALEKQEARNRKLVEALEGEVRRRAGALHRAKAAVSVGADSRSFSSLDRTRPSSALTSTKTSSFHHNKSLLEARMDAFEHQLSTLKPSKALF